MSVGPCALEVHLSLQIPTKFQPSSADAVSFICYLYFIWAVLLLLNVVSSGTCWGRPRFAPIPDMDVILSSAFHRQLMLILYQKQGHKGIFT